MNKLLVYINVPLLQKKYEVYVPINITVNKFIRLLVKALNEMTDGAYNKNCVLYSKKTSKIYDNNLVIKDTDIRNSSELILI